MKRQIGILAAALCVGLWMMVLAPEGRPVVQAKEESTGNAGALQMREPVSRGNLVYRDGGKEAAIYAADFSLLYGKLSAVSGKVFDPMEYANMHRWEYRNGDDCTYTEYSVLCENTLTDVYKAESEGETEPDSPSVSENTVEETELPEDEISDEETTMPEPSEANTPDGETEEPQPEKLPVSEGNDLDTVVPHEVSVSGNDCAGEAGQNGIEGKGEETADEGGEK